MGVHGLWELLAPVGRRVSVETLAGKRIAIDASIWMIQFMKAMRDEKGEMVRNAHLLGFFRRICKLLFLRTKPVFVFDGGTPALKRRTVISRRRQRENAQTKIRKTAEKLLLNHLKAMRLKELAKDLENQKQKNDAKGKKVITDQTGLMGNTSEEKETVLGSNSQEALDEMLAASLAAEEDESFTANASTYSAGIPTEEEDVSEDEEMILPTMHGKVDPAVLAALPPSMQLDLLVQMRERLMAENRQKYQKVKKAPERFSELQIQAYLKTVAFRREIDEVQKSAAGRGIGGVQTSRIASEANREFIFSSSFTGDKQVLTSTGVERNDEEQRQTPMAHPSESLDVVTSTKTSDAASGLDMDEPRKVFDNDVETYLDDRGRVRVSRVRAMGIRMTRDLQRNLDLMKEIEQERRDTNPSANNGSTLNKNDVAVPRKFPSKIQLRESLDQRNDGNVHLNNSNEDNISRNITSIEISFEDDDVHKLVDGDDDLFAHLVAGDPVMIFSADNTPPKKQSVDSASDCEWEEGVLEEQGNTVTHNVRVEDDMPLAEGGGSDESEVEWEEGSSDIYKHASPCSPGDRKAVSKGALEEEADFQEAIRRSLLDLNGQKYIDASFEDEKPNKAREIANSTSFGCVHQERDSAEPMMPGKNVIQSKKSSELVAGVERLDSLGGMKILKTVDSLGTLLASSNAVNPDNKEVLIDKPWESYPKCHPDLSRQDASGSGHLLRDTVRVESITPIEDKGAHLTKVKFMVTSSGVGEVPTTKSYSCVTSHISDSLLHGMPDVILGDVQRNEFGAAANDHSNETKEWEEPSVKESTTDLDAPSKLAERKVDDDFSTEGEHAMDRSTSMDASREQIEITEASLEEEMTNLSKECTDLGDEQRKLERNAESVSSEMFAECQELLQMFGLPYIIAPMEAEAQCAFMELADLVDGVVTDDSDVFLFGARSVYKNIFDDRKYVETYFMKDIDNELGLTQEKLIRMALLLGSDYTEGVSGIGIVNAIEVVNAFPEEDGLHKFREWIESPDPTILGKVDLQAGSSSSRKRGSIVGDGDVGCSRTGEEVSTSNQNVTQSVDYIGNIKQIFMDKHRNVSKNWHVPSTFPSKAVISAYASPQVDKSTEPFAWGKPDLFVLRKLCREKFGWATQKADELLIPVLKEYNKHETQLRLEAFYTFNERFAKIRSKRIQKAVKGITGNKSSELMDSMQDSSKSRKKRRVSSSKQSVSRTRAEPLLSEAGNSEPATQAEGRRAASRGSSVRGRRGVRRKGKSAARGRRKKNSESEYAETSSDDGNNSNSKQEVQAEESEGCHEARRPTRRRKAAKYTLTDLETDKSLKADQDCGDSDDNEMAKEEPFGNQGIVGHSAAGPCQKNLHTVGDLSLEEGLYRNYLDVGGGFCMDDAELEIGAGSLGSVQIEDPLREAKLTKEYLKMGAGFCLDEDEVNEDQGNISSSPKAIIFKNVDVPHCSSSGEKAEHDIGPVQLVSQANVEKDDYGTSPISSLSAMPHLRRKRRKS